MLLTEVIGFANAEALRDGDFEDLGFLFECRNNMFTFVEHSRYLGALQRNNSVRAVLTTPELAHRIPGDFAVAVCENPRLGFAKIHNCLCATEFYWKNFKTVIDSEAEVHPSASVAEQNVRIGRKTRVGPHATILERCVLGDSCVIGAQSVLGGVGMQTVRTGDTLLEMQHAGGCTLDERVQVLPGAVIATGLFRQNTYIGCDARIGSQSFVSHGVHVGRGAFIGHGSVVNGNVKVGDHAWIGPGAIISQTLTIGQDATVSLGAVVISDVEPGARVSGNFAVAHRALLRNVAEMKALG